MRYVEALKDMLYGNDTYREQTRRLTGGAFLVFLDHGVLRTQADIQSGRMGVCLGRGAGKLYPKAG